MALAIDASTPAPTSVGVDVTSVTSASFSPPAGSVIVLAYADGADSGASAHSISSVTDSLGSHLTWNFLVRSNTVSSGSLSGTCEFWYASCPSSQTNMTVSVTLNNTTNNTTSPVGCMLPIVFTGADTTQNGATGTASSTTGGTITKSITTTRANSWVIACGHNDNNSTNVTAGSGQTATVNGNDTRKVDSTDLMVAYVLTQTATTASSGTSVTMNCTAPTNVQFNFAVLEVLEAASATYTGAPRPQLNAYRM